MNMPVFVPKLAAAFKPVAIRGVSRRVFPFTARYSLTLLLADRPCVAPGNGRGQFGRRFGRKVVAMALTKEAERAIAQKKRRRHVRPVPTGRGRERSVCHFLLVTRR
jgi:hypothetical protein